MENEVLRRLHVDAAERRYTFELAQDVEDIVERNKALKSVEQKSDWGKHVASVPLVTLTDWFYQYSGGNPKAKMFGNPEFDAFCARKLKSSEWLYLRTDK